MTFAHKYWNIAPNKVGVTGLSNGGTGSWFFSGTQPKVFSAGIPMASSYSTIGTYGKARKIDTPLLNIIIIDYIYRTNIKEAFERKTL